MVKNPLVPSRNSFNKDLDPLHKSAGILDDYAVRKDIQTRTLTAEGVTIAKNTAGADALTIRRSSGEAVIFNVPSGNPQQMQIQTDNGTDVFSICTGASGSYGEGDFFIPLASNDSGAVPVFWYDASARQIIIGKGANQTNPPLTINADDSGGTIDRHLSFKKEGTENLYYGEYLGYNGFVNPIDNGSLFFGIATDAFAIQAYMLIADDDILIDGATIQISSGLANVGFYGATPVAQHTNTSQQDVSNKGAGTTVFYADFMSAGSLNVGTTEYSFDDVVDALKNIGIMAV